MGKINDAEAIQIYRILVPPAIAQLLYDIELLLAAKQHDWSRILSQ